MQNFINYKKFYAVFFFFIIFSLSSIANDSVQKYYVDTSHIPDDFSPIIDGDNEDFTFNNNNVNNNLKYLCGNLLDENNAEVNLSTEYITDFDFENGSYSCTYVILGTGQTVVSHFKIKGWNKLVESNLNKAYTLFNQAYKPNEYDEKIKYANKLEGKSLSLMGFANNEGLVNLNGNSYPNKDTVTVSKFVNNLVTLNPDYVKGVDASGNIILSDKVENNLTFLNNKDDNTILGKIKKFITNILPGDNEEGQLDKNIQAISQIDYFDKKLFGLYYNFMNIGWGSLFNYASALFLSFLALYLGANVGFKYAIHYLEHEDERGRFEFPVKARLSAIAMTFLLTFIQFPNGSNAESTVLIDKEQTQTIESQTTLAKEAISYLGNIGAMVADYAAGAVETLYMEYLLRASNSYDVADFKAIDKSLKEGIIKQRLRRSFFKTACEDAYSTTYGKYKTFTSVSNVYEDPEWTQDLVNNSDWYDNSGIYIFGYNGKKNNAKPALSLCAKIEKRTIIKRDELKAQKEEVEAALTNFENYQDKGANPSKLFAEIQLEGVKHMGWYAIASIPVLQVFLKNTDLIKTVSELKASSGGYSPVTLAEASALEKDSKDNLNKGEQKYLKEDIEGETKTFSNIGKEALKYQVYFMLPGFYEVFDFSKDIVRGSVQGFGGGILWTIEKLASACPPLKYTFKVIGGVARLFGKIKNWFSLDKKKASQTGVLMAVLVTLGGFFLAVALYNMMVKVIFATVVTLLITMKIVFYVVDVFVYYFVSPFVVGWQMTINERTDKLHRYISNGFILLTIRPSLIVFSTMMFVIGMGIMESIYHLIFDIVFAAIELARDTVGGGSWSPTGYLMLTNIKGVGEIFVDIVGIILAYKLIMDGDKLFLDKFGYRDENESSIGAQVSEKIQYLAGKI